MTSVYCSRGMLIFSSRVRTSLALPPRARHPFTAIDRGTQVGSIAFVSPDGTFGVPKLSTSRTLVFGRSLHGHFHVCVSTNRLSVKRIFTFLSIRTTCDRNAR